jgi:hypothetical protein
VGLLFFGATMLLPALYVVCLLGVAMRVFTLAPSLAVAGIIILLTGWPLFRLGHKLFGGRPAPREQTLR